MFINYDTDNSLKPSTSNKTEKTHVLDTNIKYTTEKLKTTKLSPLATPYPPPPPESSSQTSLDSIPKKSTDTTNKKLSEEKLRLKLERLRIQELRLQSNARFKNYLASLPVLNCPNHTIECITDLDEANRKIIELTSKESIFGVDLEWPPNFVKGQIENKVSLVQICSSNKILLIQLYPMPGVPIELRRFFENRNIYKSGVNICADGLKLYRDFGFLTNGLVELRDMADSAISPQLALSHLRSLRALTGMFLDQNMSKGKVRLSNWGKVDLTPIQIKYAALDAYASYMLYVVLKDLQDPTKSIHIKHLADDPPSLQEKKSKKKDKKSSQEESSLDSQENTSPNTKKTGSPNNPESQ